MSLTNNEKIEFFYQMVGVDSVKDYKNKMTVLNMTTFHKDKKDAGKTPNDGRQTKTISMDESGNNGNGRSKSQEDQESNFLSYT